MKVTAVTKYKHGDLWAVLKKLGWSQNELARRTGVSPQTIGRIINLRGRPEAKVANAIQRALGEAGEYLDVLETWPETFSGFDKNPTVEQTQDVPRQALLGCKETLMVSAPQPDDLAELKEAVHNCLSSLPENEREVLEARYFDGKSQGEIANNVGVTPGRVSQREIRALRRLRSPQHVRKLEGFYRFSE